MTRQDLRSRYPLHNETMLAKGFIPPPARPNRHYMLKWLIDATIVLALLGVGSVFGLVFLTWFQGA